MRWKKVLFWVVLICAILSVNAVIVSLRNKSGTDAFRYDPSESIPLLLLGSFRGIAVDFLWTRALARHEEKKYYELLTINNLIAKLQPNFPAVWIFQAWNMAYNIAHEWDAPQNKWKWIRAGLDFAKKGAVKNPESGDLFFELGYMYFHLFDQRFFKHAAYYRKQLRNECGEDNYDLSLYWQKMSLLYTIKLHNRSAIERNICHTLWHASLCAEKEARFDIAVKNIEIAINEWKNYRSNHPEDIETNVDGFISILEKKKEFLQTLLK